MCAWLHSQSTAASRHTAFSERSSAAKVPLRNPPRSVPLALALRAARASLSARSSVPCPCRSPPAAVPGDDADADADALSVLRTTSEKFPPASPCAARAESSKMLGGASQIVSTIRVICNGT